LTDGGHRIHDLAVELEALDDLCPQGFSVELQRCRRVIEGVLRGDDHHSSSSRGASLRIAGCGWSLPALLTATVSTCPGSDCHYLNVTISPKLLNDGEHIIVSTRTHAKALIMPAVIAIVVIAAAVVAASFV